MNWDWFLGFIEGEGTFTFTLEPRSKKDYKSGYNVPIMFQLPQKYSKKNVVLMRKIKRFLGSYGITTGEKQPYILPKKNGKWPPVKIVVFRLDSLIKLVEELKKLKWQTSKHEEFKLWCQAIEIKRSREHRKEEGIRKIKELMDKKKEIYKYSKKLMLFGPRTDIDKKLLSEIKKYKRRGIPKKHIAKILNISTSKVRNYLDPKYLKYHEKRKKR
ncbi:MAG: hypothetical protein GTN36_05005 [Candidatus Aenigmarchaeota archaeon]|nr:hypothetical protein [Candidatus Aenigmarchaeota archaeon]